MPHSDLHKKKLKKNLAVLGLIALWCALIWMITMVKMAHGEPMPDGTAEQVTLQAPEHPGGVYLTSRQRNLEETLDDHQKMQKDNARHRDEMAGTPRKWWERWIRLTNEDNVEAR